MTFAKHTLLEAVRREEFFDGAEDYAGRRRSDADSDVAPRSFVVPQRNPGVPKPDVLDDACVVFFQGYLDNPAPGNRI